MWNSRCPSGSRTRAFGVGLLTALVIASLAPVVVAATEGEGETVRIDFSVEDGEVWIKSMHAHSSRDYKGKAPYTETDVESDVRLTFEKGTQGSVSVVLEALSAQTKLNGLVQPNPAQELAIGHRNRLHLDEQGRAVAGDGYSDLMRRFERDLDPQTFARVRRQLSAETMKNGEIAEWNRPLRGLRGEEIRVGDTWRVLTEKVVQGNYVPLSGTLTFEGWTELDGMRALRVHLRYDSTGELYQEAEARASRTLNLRPEDRTQYSGHNLEILGETTWLVAVDRGLPLYETHEETMSVPLSTDADAERGELKESHIYRYRPQASADGS